MLGTCDIFVIICQILTLSSDCSETTGPIKLKPVSFESNLDSLSNDITFIKIDAVVFPLQTLRNFLSQVPKIVNHPVSMKILMFVAGKLLHRF